MAAQWRLAGGLLVLIVYAWALTPLAGTASSKAAADPELERWLASSADAFAAGRYGAALDPTLHLVERFPGQQVYAGRLARIYNELGRPADEAAAWERVLATSPTPIDACPAIGNAYSRAGDSAKALDAFERCVAFDPKNAEQLFFLGLAYEHAGRADAARQRYAESLASSPGSADSQLGLGRLALRANDVDTARQAATAVIARFPANADALLLAALVAERQGRLLEARELLARGRSAAPNYDDIRVALERVDAKLQPGGRARR